MSDIEASSSASTAADAPPTNTNGKDTPSEAENAWADMSSMTEAEVRGELERVREERDSFESQYRGLLSKLGQMRATLGDRLRQDAEELDRREAQIDSLTSETASLQDSVKTLTSELVTAHSDVDRLTKEVDSLRTSLASRDEQSRLEKERELHEQMERLKLDLASWTSSAHEEKSRREMLESQVREAFEERDRALASEDLQRQRAEREARTAAELQAVLAEFQDSQETELMRSISDHQARITSLTSELEEYKQRAHEAEAKVSETSDLASRTAKLSQEVKEKNLLIGKLRHEAVILNEHLTEALRRLRNDQSDANVDKKLVTNLVIQFITTPRADGKRFEMLNLIAGVLGWKDEEREAVGLQKPVSTRAEEESQLSAQSSVAGDESFSNLFVEFLLSEAERGASRDAAAGLKSPSTTAPTTPKSPSFPGFTSSRPVPLSPSSSRPSLASPDLNGTSGGIGSYFGLSRGRK
ncbi:hypothetical protein BCV70DRAFT_161311 [Testicularia cyperi]|uniref:GRIP domain-containing protein n=1 Tax=Testicularia cyperi TaxID=1882483 RepID=A0A317XPL8_9BASI|nr:hypothetical protein BCV70DRAFT_161311 [Testicularia cyperi]